VRRAAAGGGGGGGGLVCLITKSTSYGVVTANGGYGGSGVVILSLPNQATSTTGSPTYTTSGGRHIYKFTGTGTLVVG